MSYSPPWPNPTEDTQFSPFESMQPSFFLERDFGMEDYPNTGSLLSVGGSTPSESIKDDFVSRSENKLTTMDRMEPHWAANNPDELLCNQDWNGLRFQPLLEDIDFDSFHGSAALTEAATTTTTLAATVSCVSIMLPRSEPTVEPAVSDSTDAEVPTSCPEPDSTIGLYRTGQNSAKPRGRPKKDKHVNAINKPGSSKATSKQRKYVSILPSTERKPATELKESKAPVVRKRKARPANVLTAAQKKKKSLIESRCRINATKTAVDKAVARWKCKCKYILRIWKGERKENDRLKQEIDCLRVEIHRLAQENDLLKHENDCLRLENHRLAPEWSFGQ